MGVLKWRDTKHVKNFKGNQSKSNYIRNKATKMMYVGKRSLKVFFLFLCTVKPMTQVMSLKSEGEKA